MLSVAGIEFFKAPPEKRTVFSFSEAEKRDALVQIKKVTRSEGVVLLATCDRLEIVLDDNRTDGFEPLCRSLHLPILSWKGYAYAKEGMEAEQFLFESACGLYSPLFGEDAIIAQMGDACAFSRSAGCSTPFLEQLFRHAVTAAKSVQTRLDVDRPDPRLKEAILPYLHAGKVLVIGSSAKARMLAEFLAGKGYDVHMTLRDERKRELVPVGVKAEAYDNRDNLLPSFPVVISATKGIGYAITANAPVGEEQTLIDLSMPYDIDPALEAKCHVLREGQILCDQSDQKAMESACRAIIEREKNAFDLWTERDAKSEDVERLAERIAQDMVYRMHDVIKENLDEKGQEKLNKALSDSAFKSVLHGLYHAQDSKKIHD